MPFQVLIVKMLRTMAVTAPDDLTPTAHCHPCPARCDHVGTETSKTRHLSVPPPADPPPDASAVPYPVQMHRFPRAHSCPSVLGNPRAPRPHPSLSRAPWALFTSPVVPRLGCEFCCRCESIQTGETFPDSYWSQAEERPGSEVSAA